MSDARNGPRPQSQLDENVSLPNTDPKDTVHTSFTPKCNYHKALLSHCSHCSQCAMAVTQCHWQQACCQQFETNSISRWEVDCRHLKWRNFGECVPCEQVRHNMSGIAHCAMLKMHEATPLGHTTSWYDLKQEIEIVARCHRLAN